MHENGGYLYFIYINIYKYISKNGDLKISPPHPQISILTKNIRFSTSGVEKVQIGEKRPPYPLTLLFTRK